MENVEIGDSSPSQLLDVQGKKAPKFDPAQSYVWAPTDILSLEGGELHVLKQVLNALVQPAEAQRAIAAYEALKIIDGVIARGVEANIIKEAPQEEKPNP